MTTNDRPLLTIAIPTYNRAKALNQCLKCICDQIDKNDNRLEVLVSDNCSPDGTRDVVENFIKLGYSIRYIVNSINMGIDFNVAQCYKEATGRFVVAFGDDDILLNGSVDLILKVIQENGDCGVIHLNAHDNKHTDGPVRVFSNPIDFINQIHYNITFISANIINRDLINWNDLLKYKDSFLNHTNLFFEAILHAPTNIFIHQKSIVGAGIENSEGYNFYQVFGRNFTNIMKDVEKRNSISGIRRVINNQLLIHFFPAVIIIHKRGGRKFDKLRVYNLLFPVFKEYPYYWTFCLPILFLPRQIANYNFHQRLKGILYKILKAKGSLKRVVNSPKT
jgi:abequosyltransferase